MLRGQAKVTKEMIYEFPKMPVEVIAEIADQIIRGEPVKRLPVEKTPAPTVSTPLDEYQIMKRRRNDE